MALQVLIGGLDYTQYVDLKSIQITSNIAVNADTANFDVLIPKQAIARPKGAQEVKIMNGGTIEFGGVVLQPKELALATDQMQYQVQCRDYVYFLDKRMVVNTYSGYTAGNIVKDIVANFTTGFTSNNVQGTGNSFYLPEIKFDYVAPSKAIKKMADATGFQWWVDYNKDVHFSAIATIPSPLPNNTLLVDTDTANYSSLELDEDVSQVRNQIYLKGYKVPADYTLTDNFVADGQNNMFVTKYEIKHQLTGITVTVGGTAYAKAIDIAGGLPNNQIQDSTAYINYQQGRVRFNVAPASGTIVSITYYPMFELISLYNDPEAFTEMKSRDGLDGVYEYAIRDQQLTSIDNTLANTRGQLELYKYAYPHYMGQFDSFLQGWQPGQFFYLTSNTRMDGTFQNFQFYVVKVDKTVVSHPASGSPTLKYTVYFSDSPYVF